MCGDTKRLGWFQSQGAKVIGVFTLCVLCWRLPAQPTQIQTIPLTTGWNLISYQVGGSLTPAQFSSNLQTNGLLQIWRYDVTSGS